jgi:NhaP-type Na+/H+ or K+/H+ antiporter
VDTYQLLLAILGLAVLGSAVLPWLVHRRPISVPIVYVAAGMALFALPLGLEAPLPGTGADADTNWAERLTELVVIVSLMGAGLKLRRPIGWRSWGTTWRLLSITILSIVVHGTTASIALAGIDRKVAREQRIDSSGGGERFAEMGAGLDRRGPPGDR